MKEFEPAFTRRGDMAMDVLPGAPISALQHMAKSVENEAPEKAKGFEMSYQLFGSTERCLGTANPFG